MKKGKFIWLAVIAALVLAPTLVWAQAQATPAKALSEPSFFIELYVGGGGASSQSNAIRNVNSPALGIPIRTSIPGNIDPYVLGGLKFGYWFSPYGTYAVGNLPDWARYFGFYTDFSYHKLSFANQNGRWAIPGLTGDLGFDSSGSLATWAFMFAGRYGFLPDSQLPFGRLEAFLAVGPAIFFSDQRPTANIRVLGTNIGLNPASESSVDIGLATETGVRYFFNKSISVQVSFKYRYFSPKYDFNGTLPGTVITYNAQSRPDFHLFSGQVGAAYHF